MDSKIGLAGTILLNFSEKGRMENGEWRVGNGEWGVQVFYLAFLIRH
jgi:hypothetical protein